ncbi:hypothetical protein NPX13_g4791 [Xylaria arbuscula]|uniref:Uncharacterized protein n=1 Tax=Xylaria arbuscula TaxID=114810 RepID=A0A9W8NFP9_9PEZI|nr:hypothetical protein NPX13_g4791 [Xylaria arbuscula]
MPVSSPPSRVVKRKAKADRARPARDAYEHEKRWPRRRGRYEIEAQCIECKWFFDSFDPDAKKCRICDPPPPPPPPLVETTKAPATEQLSIMQQNQAPQTASNPSTWSETPGEATQLQWSIPAHEAGGDSAQYQAYPQDLQASLGPVHSPGMVSSPPIGYLSNQVWGQDYVMSPPLPYSDGSNQSLMGSYLPKGPCEQGYNIPSSPPSYLTTSPSNHSMFPANQGLTQGYNALSSPFTYFDPAQTQTQAEEYPQPGDTSGLGITLPSQEASEGSGANKPQATIPSFRPLRPLRPLLPRETPLDNTASTITDQPQKDDHKSSSRSKAATRFRRSLNTQNLVAIAPKPNDTDKKKE